MVSNRTKSDARSHMAQHPGASYMEALRAVSGAESSNGHAPDGPTLFDALGIDDIDTHDFTAVWRENAYTDEIRVPFGYRFDGDEIAAEPASLNFYDMNRGGDGPHGGVVGRTGSGKSTFLRGLVLSLVSRYGPDKVALVLADFKGGATFIGMDNLPHVAANISKLDNDAAMVELLGATLQGEIDRRLQLITGDKQLSDIFGYRAQQEQHQGDPEWPALPNLIVIIDEMRAFPVRNLQFVEQLTRVARLGRTLGVHLLLGAQFFPGPGQKTWAEVEPTRAGDVHAQSFHEALQSLMDQLTLRITRGPVPDPSSAAWAGAGRTTYRVVSREADRRGDTETGPTEVLSLIPPRSDTYQNQDIALIERLSAISGARLLELKITPAHAAEFSAARVSSARGEIDAIIGQDAVKQQLRDFLAAGASTPPNVLLSGGPGTGKTSAVHILARTLHAAGAIAKPTVVSVSRSDLVGTVEGETAQKTRAAFDKARGGILHIANLPGLIQDRREFSDPFGQEALDTLIERMGHDDVVVVAEGHPDALRKTLENNPGLAGMFSRRLEFDPFTADELCRIFTEYAAEYGDSVGPRVADTFIRHVDGLGTQGLNAAGNGRFASNVFFEALRARNVRLAAMDTAALTDEERTTLTASDVLAALASVSDAALPN